MLTFRPSGLHESMKKNGCHSIYKQELSSDDSPGHVSYRKLFFIFISFLKQIRSSQC